MHFIHALLLTTLVATPLVGMANTCDTGRLQSPINITASQKQKLPSLVFDYKKTPLVLANDGHTLRIRINNHSQLKVGKQIYALSQVHFHTPAGDQIAGEVFPMGAHFLHKSTNGQLLALVVLFRLGEPNKTINTLLANIPKQVGPNQAIENTSIDIYGLLPTDKAYYRYMGSLTASPCTEGVEWVVLKQALTVSPAQLARYRQRYADNARAVQPVHGRLVRESTE